VNLFLLPLAESLSPPLAVVPVFVNAGAALMPAILGAVASAAALILKPRELMRAIARHPLVVVAGILIVLAVYFAWGFFAKAGTATPARNAVQAQAGSMDWPKVALELIRLQADGGRAVASPPGGAVTPAPAAAQSGPVIFRGNPQRTGFTGGESPTGLTPLWEYNEENTMYLSSPLADGDFVFGASAYLDPPKSYGAVFCLDAATGRLIWQTDVKGSGVDQEFFGFFSSPALTADRKSLIIGQGLHLDVGAELICLDAATGAVRWTVKTPLHVESSPAIEGDIVVVGAGAVESGADKKPEGDPKGRGHPGYVFAVRISDGKELWRYDLIDPESSPAIADGIAYVGSGVNGAAVAALRIAPDEELKAKGLERLVWKVETPFYATGPVSLTDDLVIIGCGKGDFVFSAPNPEGVVIALEKSTGKVRWQTKLPDAILGAIALKDGKAIVPVRNGELVALDLRDGAILWRQENPADRISGTAPLLAGPAFTGEKIYATSQDGYLAVIDPTSGRILEKHYINSQNRPGELGLTFSSPFVAGGVVYVGSETGGLRAFAGKPTP
jgi:outer membrane protein assembly factor BamB